MSSSVPATYKAFVYESFGTVEDVLTLKQVATEPLPAGYVRVKVHSAALNPIDWKVPEVYGAGFSRKTPSAEAPFRIGFDVAGEVAEVGADVKGFQVGDAVYAMAGKGEFGSLAEYLSVDTRVLAHKPTSLDFEHAAGVPLASLTSFQGLRDHAKLQPGERVLIIGGSSATGIYAVQHAKALGAYVITTASTAKVDTVKSLGADEVIDYRTQKWSDAIEHHSLDVVYDCGVEPLSWEDDAQLVLKKEGSRFVTLKRGLTPSAAKFGATYSEVFTTSAGQDLAEITKLYERGEAKVLVDSVFPLEQTKEAFTRLKTGRALGKVVVKVLNRSLQFAIHQTILKSDTTSIPATYKAIVHERFGPVSEILELKQVPTEPLAASHVRVKVHSAALNPIDWKVPEIYGAPFVGKPEPTAEQPYRVGWDVAGVVVEVASDVASFKVGDEVYAMTGDRNFGAVAEYFTVGTKFLAHKPKTLDFEHAAGVPLASLTAYQAIVRHAKLQAGERVLIIGGSCATGIFAVQHAKAIGAYVIATTSGKNAQLVQSLGADEVIDYRTLKWRDHIDPHSLDVVLDCGMEPTSWEDDAQAVLKKDGVGRFVTLEPFVPHSAAKFGASYSEVITVPSGEDLTEVTKLYEAGTVKLLIDSVFSLEQVKEAFARVKTGHTVGKVVIKVL